MTYFSIKNFWSRFWPIYPQDRPKFIPLLLMKFLLSLNYTLLYNSKDTLIVSESIDSGAEVIPILKGWIVIPFAMIVMLLYQKASNYLSRAGLFYATIVPFLLFFALFNYVLFPYRELLTPTQSAQSLLTLLGTQRSHLVAIYLNWYNCLFYVIAELWGVVTINLVFWGFANQISSQGEARRFYTLYSAAGDIGAMATALVTGWTLSAQQSFGQALFYGVNWVIALGLIVLMIFYYLDRQVLPGRQELNWIEDRVKIKKRKEKPSLWASLTMLYQSPHLSHIAVMVIGYSLTLNLVEVFWKALLKQAFPSSVSYYLFMNQFSFYTGLSSLLVTFFAAGQILRSKGWHFSAQITPLFVGLSGITFYLLYYTQSLYAPLLLVLGVTPTLALAYYGALQNIFSRTCKYSFFDPTKEMAYIPLDEELKTKGKAAVDVVGSRLGKSGSSWFQALVMEMMHTNSVLSIGYIFCPMIALSASYWSYRCQKLNKLVEKPPQDSQNPKQSASLNLNRR